MATDIADAPSADELAWEGTRAGLATHESEHQDADDRDDLITKLAVAETTLEAIAKAADIDVEDLEHLDENIAARLQRERAEGEKDATIPSRANTAQRKAMRLLIESRLQITRFDKEGPYAGLIVAHCKGDSGTTYNLGFDPRGAGTWRCTCPEMKGDCSHLLALKMVTA